MTKEAIDLLKRLISTPSFSSQEDETGTIIENWLQQKGVKTNRIMNNIWAVNLHFDPAKPTLLLNSHHDTVKPNKGYTRDPFEPQLEDGKLFGLGSNDAGGCLVSLLSAFVNFYEHENLNYNLLMAATAEEESSGQNGLNSLLSIIPNIDVAIVGEPTLLNMAIAEKGLVVFDAKVKGTAGHAAHPNDDNPIYNAILTLNWFKDFQFEKSSEVLGDVKLTVTQINAGQQHNAIPAVLDLVVDVRVNDKYTNQEVYDILKSQAPCDELIPRSLRLNSSHIDLDHPLVQAGLSLNLSYYGSPTLSDQAVLNCPSMKFGPGDSTRSHMADEFIYINEIESGISTYVKLLEKLML